MPEDKLTLRSPTEVVVRMYGQGFGDCFLLAFPRVRGGHAPDPSAPVYVVVDSGVFFRTPGDRQRMSAVAKSIKAATGGTVDVLVATHEHHDHLCGFEYAKDDWKQIGVRRIWLAWTEDENDPDTRTYDREKEALRLQAEAAFRVAGAVGVQNPALAEEWRRAAALVGFGGEDDVPETENGAPPAASGDGGVARPPKKLSKTPDVVLDDFAREPGKRFNPDGPATERDFCGPGQVRMVPETIVDAFVLGPPRTAARLVQESDDDEVYQAKQGLGEADGGNHTAALAALARRLDTAAASDRAERESLGAALQRRLPAAADTGAPQDLGAPFRSALSLPYASARQHPFFSERYFRNRQDRQIEAEWLHGFGRLALQVDRMINNTSLVLAFRLPDGRVLLFAGDAQVGNWLSWHDIQPQDWRRPEGGLVDYRPAAADLLARTAVYKVGHHGSHNATLKRHGLEMMPDGLIAFVPTSRVYPQEQNSWNIPLPDLAEALWRKSGGRVVFPYEHPQYNYAGTEFAKRVESAAEEFAAMQRGAETIEAGVPLWRQVRI